MSIDATDLSILGIKLCPASWSPFCVIPAVALSVSRSFSMASQCLWSFTYSSRSRVSLCCSFAISSVIIGIKMVIYIYNIIILMTILPLGLDAADILKKYLCYMSVQLLSRWVYACFLFSANGSKICLSSKIQQFMYFNFFREKTCDIK